MIYLYRTIIMIALIMPVILKNLVYPDNTYLENYSKLYTFGLFIAMLIWWITVLYARNWHWKKFSQKDLKSFLKERKTSQLLKLIHNWLELILIFMFAIIGEWHIFLLWLLSIPALALIENYREKIFKEYQNSGIEDAEYTEI